MRLIPMNSSNLAGLAYDGEKVYAQFNNGSVYTYRGVDEDVLLSVLFDPDSQGKSFNAKIKGGNYPYEKLSDEAVDNLGFHV